jgi:hypothetical protein
MEPFRSHRLLTGAFTITADTARHIHRLLSKTGQPAVVSVTFPGRTIESTDCDAMLEDTYVKSLPIESLKICSKYSVSPSAQVSFNDNYFDSVTIYVTGDRTASLTLDDELVKIVESCRGRISSIIRNLTDFRKVLSLIIFLILCITAPILSVLALRFFHDKLNDGASILAYTILPSIIIGIFYFLSSYLCPAMDFNFGVGERKRSRRLQMIKVGGGILLTILVGVATNMLSDKINQLIWPSSASSANSRQ